MSDSSPRYELLIAETEDDVRDAQRLRYQVFVEELGGDGVDVDHENRLERDEFDRYFDHLILYDRARAEGDQAVGAYRVMRDDQAEALGRYYTDSEYDLTPLKTCGRKLLELGRSCVHPDYRGGSALPQLWVGLMNYSDAHGIDVMFGVASFHGTDLDAIRLPLAHLHHNHLAPPELRTRVLDEFYESADLMDPAEIDEKAAMKAMPALIKAYLRLGGVIGDGAFVDAAFNTTDVCIIVDMAKVPAKQRAMYERLARREASA
ncbi:GNAT family N-acyltransferase [Maritimibacter sp. UBA3975]|uniref:GNAT family N-acetyltransferase n=1 Tax=Maritimibacter sp. UBA3975 TaxID=1946833 RepID=UPI000C09A287|nr:GNAT family N-acyltransferase [Maritimibacter sp. UBA3975]MAM61263.1 ornithine-acyl-ACP acyltransferase [Maritimibacter sp.]|tara:strand:- start:553 stop:1338 length:786 start_codon:yes stop_codon:yes gene_type:complete